MEKKYLIKILAKKDATLNYKTAMALIEKVLAEETGTVDLKLFYVLNDIDHRKKFLKVFI